jgi:periplasmic divalent cation tolerance protein
MDEAIVILCTAPNAKVGESLGRGLVDARLAACVNLIPGLFSIYRWKDDVQAEPEVQLVIKTRRALAERVTAWVTEHHPYEVPEVLVLPVIGGSEKYLEWLRAGSTG